MLVKPVWGWTGRCGTVLTLTHYWFCRREKNSDVVQILIEINSTDVFRVFILSKLVLLHLPGWFNTEVTFSNNGQSCLNVNILDPAIFLGTLFQDIVHVLVKTLRNSISVYWEFGLHWNEPAVTTGNKQARRAWFTYCCCCLSSNCRNSKPLPRPAAYWRPGWNMFTENSGCLISEGGLWIFPSRWHFSHSSGLLNHLFTSDPAGAPV